MRVLLLTLLLGTFGLDADSQPVPLAVSGGETFMLRGPSAEHPIHVVLPPGYDAERAEPYPVLYYADGWWLTELVAGVYRIAFLSRPSRGDAMEPVVLVGIGTVGDAEDWNRQRTRDLTPSPIRLPPGVRMNAGGAAVDSAATGGGPAFLDFVTGTLAPRIEADYHVDADRRGWLGHSFGGLFGAWTLQARPGFFHDVLLIAPSAFWNQGEVIGAGFPAGEARIFIAYGESEDRPIVRSVPRMVDAMASSGLTPTLRTYPDADHQSVLAPAVWDGLVHLYGQ